MRIFITLGAVLALAIFSAGCTGDDSHRGHSHEGDEHADHEQEGTESNDHGEEASLGEVTASGFTASVAQFGEIKVGAGCAFEIEITAGGEPKAIRAWIGEESGRGMMKSKAEDEGSGHYHVHIELTEDVQAGHQLWIEFENSEGTKETAGVALEL